MDNDRIESAVQRIEKALSRIADVADRDLPTASEGPTEPAPAAMPPNISRLINTHEALRETVLNEIDRLDEIIGKLEA